MRAPARLFGPVLLFAVLALAACDTAEERAEAHYQSGMALLAEGDAERAKVEFRNVFRLNGSHTRARLEFAEILRAEGDIRGALGQYLRLVEQDPQSAEGHRNLTEFALVIQDFETAEYHAAQAYKLAPDDPQVRALKATVGYRDGEDRAGAVEMARAITRETPENVAANMVLIADRLAADEPEAALALIDAALARVPEDEGLHLARLATLERMGDMAAIGAELTTMAALFPDNDGVRTALIQWHLRSGDADGAEAVLREAAAEEPDNPEPALTVVQFLLELHGPEAAHQELEALIARAAGPRPYQRALAELDFAEGRTEEAIAALTALIQGAEPSDATRDLQTALARMLLATGRSEESAALIASVLEGDRDHVAALKLHARMAIDDDRPEVAIQDMRAALAQAPRDPELMTIMAMAHEREGSRDLAGERLALAVEVSGGRAAESLRYARFLMQDDRTGPAEAVIKAALHRAPEDRDLLLMLGEIHLARGEWSQTGKIAGLLRGQGDPAADAMADVLETNALRGQGRTKEATALLRDLAGTEGGNAEAMAGLVRSYVEAGDLDAARAHLEGVLAEDPADVSARLMRAGLYAIEGETQAAEALYRDILAEAPGLVPAHQALFTLLAGEGRLDAAEAALDAGIAAAPDAAALLFTKAGLLEAQGDIDGAIALYEDLYARDTASPVLANNLASLITSHRDDAQSLERAFQIARRLRSSDVPEFQDTYGWILARRGDPEQALDFLEPAAAALEDNALVQFHLGEAYFALERWKDARAAFERTVALGEGAGALPQIAEARARLTAIDARPDTPTEG